MTAYNNGGVKIFNTLLSSPAGLYSRNILFVGIKDVAGTSGDFELQKDITSKNTANTLFGRNSHIMQGIRPALDFLIYNSGEDRLTVNAVGIDSIGTQATANILFGGATTEAGTIKLYVGDSKNPKTLAIASGQTSAQVASAVNTLINDDLDLFFTSAVNGGDANQVDFTAASKGTFANYISIAVEDLPAGLTATPTQFSGGDYTGLLASAFDALKNNIANDIFHTIVIEKDLLDIDSTLKDYFDNRALIVDKKVLIGQVLFADIDATFSNITNDYKTNTWGVMYIAPLLYQNPYVMLSDIACMKEGRLVVGFAMNKIVSNIDATSGGPARTNIPINNMRLNTIDTLRPEEQFSRDEIIEAKAKGMSPIETNDNGLAILTGNQSTYIEDAQGNTPSLNRITSFEKIGLATTDLYNRLTNYIDKVLVASLTEGATESQFTKEDLESDLHDWVDSMAGIKETQAVTGVITRITFAIFPNDPILVQTMKDAISRSVKKLQAGRTLQIETLGTIASIVENIIAYSTYASDF